MSQPTDSIELDDHVPPRFTISRGHQGDTKVHSSKFSLIPVGTRFELDGENHVKTAPLIARNESTGQQRVIPRSADVKLLDQATVETPPDPGKTVSLNRVMEEFDRFYSQCNEIIAALGRGLSDEPVTQAKKALELARRGFTEKLSDET